jgi:uncharacterized protein YlxW (UPF0749 family)
MLLRLIAYSTALTDLIMELDSSSSAKEHSRSLNNRIRTLDAELKSVQEYQSKCYEFT